MDILAKARYIRHSPRKVRLVADLVRGLPVAEAAAQLSFLRKAAAPVLLKLLRSAIANAENNFKLDAGKLWIKRLTVDGGPTIKRFRPRAFGRGAPIKKRTAHINIILTDEIQKSEIRKPEIRKK
ncbi:50S ribosomal protein L22 [Patescibacteria group bacterium]|nr:MAG: 50S ribosomal protein L22 [Patescibacteria group bacterium]